MYETVWYGRGGQGVVLAAQILAEAAYIQGYKGVTSAPTFGPERRGAPLTASTKIADLPIRSFAQIEYADIAVVLDPSLLQALNVPARVKAGGIIIINSPHHPDSFDLDDAFTVASINAVEIALKYRLAVEGVPAVNTPLLGSLSKVAGIVRMENIEKGMKRKLPARVVPANYAAAVTAFEKTVVKSGVQRLVANG